ncbi:MAG TPA: uroporphyrinogen decarboxylase family protein [Verrucomicrobiae bacterium]
MTDAQWSRLLAVIRGKEVDKPPVGFIIDSPWLPNWFGTSILDYFTNEDTWFQANRRALETFTEVMFLPGFWSEFGMCTEPSAFGSKCVFYQNEFPFADKLIREPSQIADLVEPNPKTDGLLPFMLNRLKSTRRRIENLGHKIRFSVSRGPLNIASFLMGTTEFLMTLKTDPGEAHKLLRLITAFLQKWHEVQRETFDTIDGIFVLDDIVGFVGEQDFKEFGYPYFKELYSTDVSVKFFHNDAQCAKSIKYYSELGINLYNPGVFNTIGELFEMSGNKLAILGNIPPRDVLAKGSPREVGSAVNALLRQVPSGSRLVLSCAGGMPPGVSTENLRAFVDSSR